MARRGKGDAMTTDNEKKPGEISDRVIDRFLGDAACPIDWDSDQEKCLHFWVDDLHCPQPISPMWFDVGGWWYTCDYMYRRFGAPFGKAWVAKKINEYVLTAVVPRPPAEAAELAAYYEMVMPVYAEKFLEWWERRYLPEILRNFEYLDTFPMDSASLAELMILLEEALDIQERHFRLHWILNLAQFQSAFDFEKLFKEIIGEKHANLVGRILVSDEDRNWDSIRELWKLKELVKKSPLLRQAFDKSPNAADLRAALSQSGEGKNFLELVHNFSEEFGNKAIYSHEYIFPTWREDSTPFVEALRGYVSDDFDYPEAVRKLRENRAAAIAEMWSLFPANRTQADRENLEKKLDCALKMAPLTPDHHFYMDQGTYARVRLVLMAIGQKLVDAKLLVQPDDIMFLKYHELRVISANPSAFDAKARASTRRAEREAAFKLRPPAWAGTITEWSLHGEPYKTNWGWPDIYTKAKENAKPAKGTLRGLGASAGVVEGRARLVNSVEQFDQIEKGEILVCKMTNPAWVMAFTKIAGLVTDAGGALSHPAVVSREFGVPAVVGTGKATQEIKTGQRIRLNGSSGVVELLD